MIEAKNIKTLCRLGKAGTAAIELALCTPFLMILLVSVIEIGTSMYGAMQAHNAVEAGMVYAAKNGWSSAGISAAVVNGSNAKGMTASPAPTQFCGCPNTSTIAVATCGTKCADGYPAGSYIQINATLPHTTIMPGLSLPATATAKSVFRLG